MLRLMASISAIVCSAVLMVLPAGVFITTIPARVAECLSMLSVPTPARTTALSRVLPSSTSGVSFTPLRQMAPSNSLRASLSSAPLRPVRTSWVNPGAAFKRSRPSWANLSRTMTLGIVVIRV